MSKDKRGVVPFAELEKTYNAYMRHGESVKATSESIGLGRASVSRRLLNYKTQLENQPGLSFPEFPAADFPIDRIIDTMKERGALRKNSYAAHTWFPIKVNDKKPIGIMWYGDPHIDDDGCDWDLLTKHINLCKQPGVYGVNIGDTTNNWAGRLVKKYGDQETSAKTASRLAEWFMLDAGIKWMLWLLGNHDAWGDGASILAQMAKRHGTQKLVLHDWEARFSLNFPNGCSVNIWAAHDFPGDSMWNPLHGPVKAARFGPDVHLLVCGHKHNWGIAQWELADKGTSPIMIRTRGYKFNDDYARHIGKQDQEGGSSIFTIIDPNSKTREGRIIPFADVEKGAAYLQFLRQ